jgi:hypothetical protein
VTAPLLLAFTLSVTGTQPGTAAAPVSPVVAEHRGVVVTLDQVRDLALERSRSGDPRGMMQGFTVDGRVELVHELLRQQALAREARRVGLEGRPDVARRLGRLSDQVLAEALVAQVRSDADVSEAALRAFYRDEADRFRSAPRRKLRHLLAASETEARAALEAIVAGQAFANVAAERSRDAQTRAQGGDLGWVPRGVMVAAFDEAAFALPVGIPSTPVRTSFGWHLILVEEIDPGSLPPFELIADRVKEALQTARLDAVLQRLIDPGSIVVDRAALESLK